MGTVVHWAGRGSEKSCPIKGWMAVSGTLPGKGARRGIWWGMVQVAAPWRAWLSSQVSFSPGQKPNILTLPEQSSQACAYSVRCDQWGPTQATEHRVAHGITTGPERSPCDLGRASKFPRGTQSGVHSLDPGCATKREWLCPSQQSEIVVPKRHHSCVAR